MENLTICHIMFRSFKHSGEKSKMYLKSQTIFPWFAAKQINGLKSFLTCFLQTIKKICLKRWKVVISCLTTLIHCTLVDIKWP